MSASLACRTYMAFKAGARLTSHDVERILASEGVVLSSNRLRELGRNSDRGRSISEEELFKLVSGWAKEQRAEIDATPMGETDG